jgi:tetratricopeptide (TPR) repeat protein
VSAGIPGTGISYRKTLSGNRRIPSARSMVDAPQPVKPGILASKGEKLLYKAITSNDRAALEEVGRRFDEYRPVAFALAGLMLAKEGHDHDAQRLLSSVMQEGSDPAAHPFVRKYIGATGVRLGIAPGVVAEVPFGLDAVGLTLAELLQESGFLDEAIDTVERLEPTAHAAVSLAELYVQAERYDEVIDLTNGIKNTDDATALLCVYRGVALREKGLYDASREAFKEALKSKSRDPQIRHLGLSERSYTYLAENKKSMARKDLERVVAEDSNYPGIQERLAELA